MTTTAVLVCQVEPGVRRGSMLTIADLKSRFTKPGRVEWIGIAGQAKGPIRTASSVDVQVGTGIDGEHHAQSGRSDRQVTLIQAEHLDVVASLLGRDRVGPEEIRRNIMVSGVSLLALKDRRFQIGSVVLEGSGPCVPCSRMERNLGEGGYNAMRGHGGITAIVVQAGQIRVGDAVEPVMGETSHDP